MADAEVVQLPGNPNVPIASESDLAAQIRVLQRWRKILAVRWLALLALIGAVAIWSMTAVDPLPWRFVAACGYSIGVLVPSFVLYWLRSD